MKKFADQKRQEVEFKIGDMVLVKLQHYRQNSLALRKNKKLGLKYFGPFPIIQHVGQVTYKLLLPYSAKIHPVFHCSQLKPCHGDHNQPYVPLPMITNEIGLVMQPISILQSRRILRGGQLVNQVLLAWEGFNESQATWEDYDVIKVNYPSFNLEDKVDFNGGGHVREEEAIRAIKETTIVSGSVHVAPDPKEVGTRRSTRTRITNSRLKGFVCDNN